MDPYRCRRSGRGWGCVGEMFDSGQVCAIHVMGKASARPERIAAGPRRLLAGGGDLSHPGGAHQVATSVARAAARRVAGPGLLPRVPGAALCRAIGLWQSLRSGCRPTYYGKVDVLKKKHFPIIAVSFLAAFYCRLGSK